MDRFDARRKSLTLRLLGVSGNRRPLWQSEAQGFAALLRGAGEQSSPAIPLSSSKLFAGLAHPPPSLFWLGATQGRLAPADEGEF